MASAGKIKKQPTVGLMSGAEAPAQPTSIAAWRKNNGPATFVVTLPSGNVVRLKRVGLTALLAENIFPDPLMKVVMEQINKAEKGPGPQDHKKPKKDQEVDLAEILKNQSDLTAMMHVMDKATAFCVVEPPMAIHFTEIKEQGSETIYRDIPFEDRDVETIYTDEVSDEDKMEIFNFAVGGDSTLKTFR